MLNNTQNYVLLRNSCIFAPVKQWRDLSSLQPRKKMLKTHPFLTASCRMLLLIAHFHLSLNHQLSTINYH